MHLKYLLGLILVFCANVANVFAANVQYSGLDVVGVSGLIIDGQSYTATFFDGSYNNFLAAYPEPANDISYTDEFAEAATNALYEFAILEDGFAGINGDNISGCTSASCFLSTTVTQDPLLAWTFEFQGSNPAFLSPIYLNFHQDYVTNYTNTTNILWTATTVVPVPAAVWLFGSAFGMIGWVRRRR